MADLITDELVDLGARFGDDPASVVRGLAELIGAAGRTTDPGALSEDVVARELTSPTGLPGGIAIPHCRTAAVTEPVLAFARLGRSVDFGAADRSADLIFLIAAPMSGGSVHLAVLSALARALARPSFAHTLRGVESAGDAVETIRKALGTIETT